MKGLLKIYRKYMATAFIFIFLLFVLNILVYLTIVLHSIEDSENGGLLSIRNSIDEISGQLRYAQEEEGPRVFLAEEGVQMLRENGYVFAMLLSPEGDVIYGWQLPDELNRHYSLGDVAAFSRWYLNDYPVKVWRSGENLLVCGEEKGKVWKYAVQFPKSFIANLPGYLFSGFLCNLLLIFILILIIGYRFYHSLSPVAVGIDSLAEQKAVFLPEKGIISDLSTKINQASLVLQEQKEIIEKRDTARTDWISGVSHDIRTPLSMIMGYADALSDDPSLSSSQREQAGIIRQQSLFIKSLIEDLNLTSKLEYHMQPLRPEVFAPAPFLRELVATCLNHEFPGEQADKNYELSLSIEKELETVYLNADRALLTRAVRNLIHNSIRHNPDGCGIRIAACLMGGGACSITVTDDGKGIPEQVVRILNQKDTDRQDGQPHVMGLRIVRQIVLAHDGNFRISADRHSVLMELTVYSGCNSRTAPAYDRSR